MTKISDATLVGSVNDNIKMPTGEIGDFAISVGQIKSQVSAQIPKSTLIDTTTSPIVLDSEDFRDIIFNGSVAINANKIITFDNDSGAYRKVFLFTITGTPTLTLPSNCKMPSWQAGWVSGPNDLYFAEIGAGDFSLEFIRNSVEGYFKTTLEGAF